MLATPPTGQRARSKITDADIDFFVSNGYLVVEDAFSPSEVAALHGETVRICRGQLGAVKGLPSSSLAESDNDVMRHYVICDEG